MASYSIPFTIETPAGSTEFNPTATGDGFFCLENTSGFDQAPIRAVNDDKSQTDGAIAHDRFKGGRLLAIAAAYKIITGTVADRDVAIDNLIEQLDSILAATGTLTQHRDSGDRWLTVKADSALASSGGTQLKQVVFGLIAPDPNWT